eukprot:CAMPEP_0168734818 /NCGR_PEP_ID=MMETSP0724-20121128/9012_1 /TAXON_ID=265536 /ORGANISM="Amphiprora sp., Strain CCMP467" /LENGTH=158 /DNA_ID=CAMNT_0008781939 /DNA_START=53 /DNA_END=527 /DNA_ORIENTATION=-
MHVLLCGRMPGLLNQLTAMLEQQGHTTEWVVTDQEAIAKLQGSASSSSSSSSKKFEAVWIAPPYSLPEQTNIEAAMPQDIQSFQVMRCCPQDLMSSVARVDQQLKDNISSSSSSSSSSTVIVLAMRTVIEVMMRRISKKKDGKDNNKKNYDGLGDELW